MKVTQPELENSENIEVQMTKDAGTIQSSNSKYEVQPNPNNYATSGISKQNINQSNNKNNIQQTVQNTQSYETPTQSYTQANQSTVVKIPSDLYDNTVQNYINSYNKGVEDNDYQAQINALTAIDNYRTSKGYETIYSQSIYELNNKRNEKINNIISAYDNQIASAMNSGNTELAQQIGQDLLKYKASVNYTGTSAVSELDVLKEQYKSSYSDVINGIVSELLTMRFTYDPNDDEALIKAQEHASNVAMEKMNAKGILDSSMTAQIVTSVVSELEATYRKMAKEEFYENLERLQSMANFVIDLDDKQYDRWKENVEMNLTYYEALKDEMTFQWDRVNNLGYVDNIASIVLGVAPRYIISRKKKSHRRCASKSATII